MIQSKKTHFSLVDFVLKLDIYFLDKSVAYFF